GGGVAFGVLERVDLVHAVPSLYKAQQPGGALDALPQHVARAPAVCQRQPAASGHTVLHRHESWRRKEQRRRVTRAAPEARQRKQQGEALAAVHARVRGQQRIERGPAGRVQRVQGGSTTTPPWASRASSSVYENSRANPGRRSIALKPSAASVASTASRSVLRTRRSMSPAGRADAWSYSRSASAAPRSGAHAMP